jgi:hypothetical protein
LLRADATHVDASHGGQSHEGREEVMSSLERLFDRHQA